MSNLWTKRAFAGSINFRLAVAGLALVAVLALRAHAQNDKMTPIATPSQPNAIELGTGPLPNAKNPEVWHSQYGSQFARNVTIATLTPYLPDPAKASGAAIVVAPGGGKGRRRVSPKVPLEPDTTRHARVRKIHARYVFGWSAAAASRPENI